MRPQTPAHLALPAASSGVLMVAYLLLRPYGDHGAATGASAASAFADPMWVVAHLCGALALANLARLALRMHDLVGSVATQAGRWAGLAGAVLVLPYYGAETFGLHAIGRAAASDPRVMGLVPAVRDHPAALTAFGVGLVLLAVAGLVVAGAWQRLAPSWGVTPWAAWPIGLAAALVLPQYVLPPPGRMAFGVAYLVAAGVLVAASRSAHRGAPPESTAPEPLRTA